MPLTTSNPKTRLTAKALLAGLFRTVLYCLLLLPTQAHGQAPENPKPPEQVVGDQAIPPDAPNQALVEPVACGSELPSMDRAQITQWLLQVYGQSLTPAQRLRAISDKFLGIPYKRDPLGEGPGMAPDTDPVWTLDGADCITILEQALAMTCVQKPIEVMELFHKIRYDDGVIAYPYRNHLTLSQWLPNLRKLGLVEDITRQVGSDQTVELRKIYHPTESCKGRWETFCEQIEGRMPEGAYALDVVPIQQAIEQVAEIPDGSLIFFLHINRPWLPYVIFHAGIVLQEEKETRLRHASKGRGKTTDVSLVRYLQFLEKRYQRWKVLGIHLEQLTDRCGTQPQP